jgi:hypothetical protein
MTLLQVAKAARSLSFRRRMTERLPDLEASLTLFLQQQPGEQAEAGNYRLCLVDGRVEVELVPFVDNRQQTLPGIFEESESFVL